MLIARGARVTPEPSSRCPEPARPEALAHQFRSSRLSPTIPFVLRLSKDALARPPDEIDCTTARITTAFVSERHPLTLALSPSEEGT